MYGNHNISLNPSYGSTIGKLIEKKGTYHNASIFGCNGDIAVCSMRVLIHYIKLQYLGASIKKNQQSENEIFASEYVIN